MRTLPLPGVRSTDSSLAPGSRCPLEVVDHGCQSPIRWPYKLKNRTAAFEFVRFSEESLLNGNVLPGERRPNPASLYVLASSS